MGSESRWESQESLQSAAVTQVNAHCIFCRRILLLDNATNEISEAICICGECKAIFLQDLETTPQVFRRRRTRRGRSRFRSSVSIDDLFSQEFSHLINLVRHNQRSITVSASDYYEQETQLDGDASLTNLPHSSSHTPQSRSRRWWRIYSDNESEGFDNMDSLYGESDSNFSLSHYGTLHGESDAVSISAYGGDSDASVDGHRNLNYRGLYVQTGDESVVDSDTDIDPMHAGLDQWYSDEQDEDGEWEDDAQTPGEFSRRDRQIEVNSARIGGRFNWRMQQSGRSYFANSFANSEQSEIPPYIRNTGDYVDARGFEELLEQLEQLVETDGSRQGAPPAAASFVGSLPRIIIRVEHEIKHGGLVCAVCKDPLAVGTEANQLPCSHLYHPECILPWLSSRNSCPVCRREFPTDDKDYEERKQNAGSRREYLELQQQDSSEDSSSDVLGDDEADEVQNFGRGRMETRDSSDRTLTSDGSGGEGRNGRWLAVAAAPIVSIIGIVLVLWFRNPHDRVGAHCSIGGRNPPPQSRSSLSSSRAEPGGRRRWWPFL